MKFAQVLLGWQGYARIQDLKPFVIRRKPATGPYRPHGTSGTEAGQPIAVASQAQAFANLKTIKITRCCCDAWNTVRRHTAAQAQYGTIWHRAQSSRIWSTGSAITIWRQVNTWNNNCKAILAKTSKQNKSILAKIWAKLALIQLDMSLDECVDPFFFEELQQRHAHAERVLVSHILNSRFLCSPPFDFESMTKVACPPREK